MTDVLAARRSQDFSSQLMATGWYHSMELPGHGVIQGFLTLDLLRERYASFGLPDDLTGKRVLDIGTWDGWFAFEAERRGADVVAVDLVEQPNFLFAHRELKSKVRYVLSDIYEIPDLNLGVFDYTLFLGVLYHLRHPLLALDIVCSLTRETAIVDSFVLNGPDKQHVATPIPWAEFYETDELGRNIDNWFGPTLECLQAFCRSASFARVELRDFRNSHATLACNRRWPAVPTGGNAKAPVLTAAVHSGNYGLNFDPKRKEEFLTCWFSADEELKSAAELYPEISGYGVPALSLRRDAEGNPHFSCRIPPGLAPGWHDVRLRVNQSGLSNALRIAVGIPVVGSPEIAAVCDARSWAQGKLEIEAGGAGAYLTLWVKGLGENCDRHNIRVFLDDRRAAVEYISVETDGVRQVNVRIEGPIELGRHLVSVRYGVHTSELVPIDVTMAS